MPSFVSSRHSEPLDNVKTRNETHNPALGRLHRKPRVRRTCPRNFLFHLASLRDPRPCHRPRSAGQLHRFDNGEETRPLCRSLRLQQVAHRGKRSGAAAKRHPGFGFNQPPFNPEGVVQSTVEPFQGSPLPPTANPAPALRLPWAMLFNRFAVGPIRRDRNENGPIVRTPLFCIWSRVVSAPRSACRPLKRKRIVSRISG